MTIYDIILKKTWKNKGVFSNDEFKTELLNFRFNKKDVKVMERDLILYEKLHRINKQKVKLNK